MTTPGICNEVQKYRQRKAKQAFTAGLQQGIIDCIPAIIAVTIIIAICYVL